MLQLHRIFCATPWDLEAECQRYYDLVGAFNESAAAPKGVLFVPVTLTNVRDKRPLQYTVDENIRACRHYILVLAEDWGPVERNFRKDYRLALEAVADPALPMQDVAFLLKNPQPGDPPPDPALPQPQATYSTMAEFDDRVNALLTKWLEALVPTGGTAV